MSKIVKVVLSILFISWTTTSLGYGPSAHESISKKSVSASKLSDTSEFGSIGLDSNLFTGLNYNGQTYSKSVLNWIVAGGVDEDNPWPWERGACHFFDPINDSGLFNSFPSSLEWAWAKSVNCFGSFQYYSYPALKNHFYDVLISNSAIDRDKDLAAAFYVLGHIIHLIQDLAVPEHVRNDQHLPFLPPDWGSLYEKYSEGKEKGIGLPNSGYAPVYSDSDQQTFKFIDDFWKFIFPPVNGKRGLAEFTNHNFVSTDTNFDKNNYKYPQFNPNDYHFENIQQLCTNNPPCGPNLHGSIWFYHTLLEWDDTSHIPPNTYNQYASGLFQ